MYDDVTMVVLFNVSYIIGEVYVSSVSFILSTAKTEKDRKVVVMKWNVVVSI